MPGPQNRSGFVILEVLPALMLLLGVVITGFRLFGLSLTWNEMSWLQLEQEASLQEVWAAWQGSGGHAALAIRDQDGRWQVIDFPHEAWLPGFAGSGNSTIQWRRRWLPGSSGPGYWEIEKKAGLDDGWVWWSGVYANPPEDDSGG